MFNMLRRRCSYPRLFRSRRICVFNITSIIIADPLVGRLQIISGIIPICSLLKKLFVIIINSFSIILHSIPENLHRFSGGYWFVFSPYAQPVSCRGECIATRPLCWAELRREVLVTSPPALRSAFEACRTVPGSSTLPASRAGSSRWSKPSSWRPSTRSLELHSIVLKIDAIKVCFILSLLRSIAIRLWL